MPSSAEIPGKPGMEQLFHVQENLEQGGEGNGFPLGEFSRFVLFEQPFVLDDIRHGRKSPDALIEKQRQAVETIPSSLLAALPHDKSQAEIATLDTGLAISATIFSGGEPASSLVELNEKLTREAGLPQGITFQKIVLINAELPYSHMRTFTSGEVGATERDFYLGHALMLVPLQNATDKVSSALTQMGQSDADASLALLSGARTDMTDFAKAMSFYNKNMPSEHFAIFRQYLAQYPDGTRNASGAFIGMPRLQLRLTGSSPSYDIFLRESMQYFPIEEQSDIQEAHAAALRGESIVARCQEIADSQLRSQIALETAKILEQLHFFRAAHYVAVRKFIGDGLLSESDMKQLSAQLHEEDEVILPEGDKEAVGTGGFLAGPLLRNIMRLNERARQKLQAIATT